MMKYKPNLLRTLARSYKWQILYNRSKELNCLHLFDNLIDLTQLQLCFLQWLEIYSSLELDLAMEEKNISREVIDDDIRADAYLLYKRKKKNKKETTDNKRKGKKSRKQVPTNNGIPGIIFTSKKKV